MTRLLEGNNKYRLIIVLLVSFFVLIIALAILLSNIKLEEKIEGTVAIILNEGDLTVNYTDGNEIVINDSDAHEYGISITNNSNSKLFYSIYFKEANINDISVKIIDSDGNIVKKIKKNVTGSKLVNLYSLEGRETVRYTVVIDCDKNVKFNGTLKVDNESMVTETFSDLILLNNNVNIAKTRVGSEVSKTDEGLISTTDNKGTTYYFRGAVKNNYVKIGDLLFRIVRINGDGSVRLVLDSTIEEMYPYNTNGLAEGAYVGSLGLLANSTLLPILNNWLESNLSSYSHYLVEGDFCSDTSFDLNFNGIYYSSSYERIFNDEAPDLYCSSGIYTGKVGLLSVDEVVFAGAAGSRPNTSYYLYNKGISGNYLTSSSYFINIDNNLSVMNVMSNGAIGEGILITNDSYIRPVVNVGVEANIKGKGTIDNPYIIVS